MCHDLCFPSLCCQTNRQKTGICGSANQKQKSLSLVVPWRVNDASMVTLRHRSDVKALRLRWKRVTFTPQTCDDCGVKIMPLCRKENERKLWKMSRFYNLLFANALRSCLRVAYFQPSPCLVANTQLSERLL